MNYIMMTIIVLITLILSELIYYLFVRFTADEKDVKAAWFIMKIVAILISSFITSILYQIYSNIDIITNWIKEHLITIIVSTIIVIMITLIFYLNKLWAYKLKGIKE